MDPVRCRDEHFFVDPAVHHAEILLSCLDLMRERLKKNICNLDNCTILSDVRDLSTCCKDHIGDALKYACCFWTKHLLETPGNIPCIKEVEKGINQFFTTCLPYWIEVLALTGNLGAGVYAINDVERWCTLVSAVQNCLLGFVLIPIQVGVVCQWTADSQRLILEHFDVISASPFYIYCFALPICPPSSWLHQYYSSEFSQETWVVKEVSAGWGTCRRMVLLDDSIQGLTYQKDTIAVGLSSGSIIILNAITGVQVAVLSGHAGWVHSLVFSPDGTSLISGGDDKTIKLWDMQTGGVIKTFEGHTEPVTSVSILPDCITIVSKSRDKTICLWDLQTGGCHHIIEQKDDVGCVCFSPLDPKHLMFVSGGKIQQLDISSQQITPVSDGYYIAFSSDGSQFAVCNGSAVEVHNSYSKRIVAKFCVAGEGPGYCCFSPDNRAIAVASHVTIYIWDITSSDPHLLETFVGHTMAVGSFKFSSPTSLISTCHDKSVRFWQIGASSKDPVPANPKSVSLTSAPIKSITLQAKDGVAISSHSDGVVRIWDLSTGLCKASFQAPVKDPHQMDTRLIDSRLISVWYTDEKIFIWDTEKGELLRTTNLPGRQIADFRISGDGSRVFCLYQFSIEAWSMWTGEAVGKVEFSDPLYPDAFLAIDTLGIWVHPVYSESFLGLDFGILGSSPVKLSDTSRNGPHLDFIGGIRMRRSLLPGIEDTVTKKVVLQLPARLARCSDGQWDGQYLVVGYDSGEVLILECNHALH